MKVISYAGFLLDSVKKVKSELATEMNDKANLIEKQHRMEEQVVCMKADWKREQTLVTELENELKFRDEQEALLRNKTDH